MGQVRREMDTRRLGRYRAPTGTRERLRGYRDIASTVLVGYGRLFEVLVVDVEVRR